MITGLVMIMLTLGGSGPVLVHPFIVWEGPFAATSMSVAPNALYAAAGFAVGRFDFGGSLIWTTSIGFNIAGLAADARGVYLVGSATSSSYNGTGFRQTNATLARVDSDGDLLWSRELSTPFRPSTPFESSTTSWGSAIAIDSSGVYVAGYSLLFYRYPQYGWVTKTDFDGNQLWVERVDPIAITSAISSGSDAVYVSGYSKGCLGTDSADVCPVQSYVAAISLDGQTIWTSLIPTYCGPTSHDSSCDYQGRPQTYAFGVSADSSAVYVAGSTQGVFSGQNATSSGRGASDEFVGKFDVNGTGLWFRQFGTAFSNTAFGISTNPRGTFVVGSDGLRQFDPNGNQVWLLNLNFTAYSVSTSRSGGVFLGGYSSIAEVCAAPSCRDT